MPHPEVGARQHVGAPWRFSGTPSPVDAPAPCLGEHTHDVLEKILGYTAAEIDALVTGGVVEGP